MTGAASPGNADQSYSIDADPAGIRARVGHAIRGAMAYGAMNTNPPPNGHWLIEFWNLGRAQSGTQPLDAAVVPDGMVLMPRSLTAENGAKGLLIGEFREGYKDPCPVGGGCCGDGDCEHCNGTGIVHETVAVSWTTIKAIYAKAVEHFAAQPVSEAAP